MAKNQSNNNDKATNSLAWPELVYPVYLDTPMMLAFLASQENGVIEETAMEQKETDTKESGRTGNVSAQLGGLFSGLLNIGAQGELTRQVSENLESQYTSTVRFPQAALFIRLRELLLSSGMARHVNELLNLENVKVGDLVECAGFALPNPSYQIRRVIDQILPIMDPLGQMQVTNIEQGISTLKNAKTNHPTKVMDRDMTFPDQASINSMRNALQLQRQGIENQLLTWRSMADVFAKLIPVDDLVRKLVLRSEGFHVICTVDSVFARNAKIQEMYDANWRCIGKVVRVLKASETYDLLQESPLGYVARDMFPQLSN